MTDPLDYRLPAHQTEALARILRLVSRAQYLYWAPGHARQDRVVQALKALHEKYRVLADPMAQHLRREAGLPVARVVLAPYPAGGIWPYLLLSTERLKGERSRSIQTTPLQWPAYWKERGAWVPTYEVYRHDRGTWTVRLGREVYADLAARLEEAVRRGEWPEVVRLLKLMYGFPMYRGIREQALALRKHAQRLWGDRHLRTPEGGWREPPWRKLELPKPLSPMRVREEGPTLGEALERLAKGEPLGVGG